MLAEQTLRIRMLNDHLRRTGTGGRVLITASLQAMGPVAVADILREIASYNGFSPDGEPQCKRDFGAVTYQGQKVFFKIEYYAADKSGRLQNIADPKLTKRVMTVFTSADY